MIDGDPNDRIPSDGSDLVPPLNRLSERVRHYFDQHPEDSREEFLLEAVWREIHFHEPRETGNGAGRVPWEGAWTSNWSAARLPRSAEDIRIHAWLAERLAALHYERYGLWPKLRRFLFGNRFGVVVGGQGILPGKRKSCGSYD
jgi:hypothetical protein